MMVLDVVETGKVVGGVIGGITALTYAAMKLLRVWFSDKKNSSKDKSESSLYDTLSEQVKALSGELSAMREASEAERKLRGEMTTELALLRAKVAHLEEMVEANKKLKAKLDEKDAQIAELREKIIYLKRKLSEYEPDNTVVRECYKDCEHRILSAGSLPTLCMKDECFNRDASRLFALDKDS